MMKNYVGIDVGCTKMHLCAIVDGEYVEHRTLTGMDCTKERIKEELDAFLTKLPFTPDGVGIALPALIEGDHKVPMSDMAGINGATANYFSDGRFPVRLINDVKAATVCEIEHYPDAKTIAVIMAGSGFAVGVYTNGKIVTGANGFAGELGHCPVVTSDGITDLDSVSGGIGILEQAGCNAETLLAKLDANDPDALALIKRSGQYFGMALTTIMHLFNPDVIVVGGSTATYKGYMESALETAKNLTLEELFKGCQITTPQDAKRIVALGAMNYIKTGMTL